MSCPWEPQQSLDLLVVYGNASVWSTVTKKSSTIPQGIEAEPQQALGNTPSWSDQKGIVQYNKDPKISTFYFYYFFLDFLV